MRSSSLAVDLDREEQISRTWWGNRSVLPIGWEIRRVPHSGSGIPTVLRIAWDFHSVLHSAWETHSVLHFASDGYWVLHFALDYHWVLPNWTVWHLAAATRRDGPSLGSVWAAVWVDAWVDGSELVWVEGSVARWAVPWDVKWEASRGSTIIIQDENKNQYSNR